MRGGPLPWILAGLSATACDPSHGKNHGSPPGPAPARAPSSTAQTSSLAGEMPWLRARTEGDDAGEPQAPRNVSDGGIGPRTADGGGAGSGPCPPEMARIGRFCVDREEAHLVAPSADGSFAPLPFNERPPAGTRFEARSEASVFPQGYINRVEATAACKNAGKRLCTMHEWRRACEGRGASTFPYGGRSVKGRCNIEKFHLLAIRYGADVHKWTYKHFNDPSLLAEPGYLARTGEYVECVSEEGVHDLVGNLHEWVSDTVDADLMGHLAAEGVPRGSQPWTEGNGVFMGGFFSTSEQHGPGCTFTTVAHEPSYHDYSVGFRCCADHKPSEVRGLPLSEGR